MANSEVHWHDGMFLRQHHFMTARQQSLRMLRLEVKWDLHHNWGLRSIQLSTEALANHRFAVTKLKARLPDGTTVEIPEDGRLQELDLTTALEQQRKVTVYLGVPLLGSGRSNVSTNGPAEDSRYYVVSLPLEDENTGTNPQPIMLRMLNLKLLLSPPESNLTGYEYLPIARVEKSEREDATPHLDATYFPPMLACDAWHDLQVGLLQSLYHRIGKQIDKLSKQAVSRGFSLESRTQGSYLIFAQLRELNEAYATLKNLAYLEGVHPLAAYQELCRAVGQLSVFDQLSRRPPEIPLYDHDNLGGCFYRIRQHLDRLLKIIPDPEYLEVPFIGTGKRMQVSLERAWLDPSAQMYIGVQSTLDTNECVRLLGHHGFLDMKIGSSDQVEIIYLSGSSGLRFLPAPTPPQALPRERGLTYFQVSHEPQGVWQSVEEFLTLAIRFNADYITGAIDDQKVLSLKYQGTETTLQFTLYIVSQAAVAAAT